AQLYALSYVYNLSKRSALYANAATLRNKGAANFSIAGGPAGARPGTNHDGYEVGMRHAF
ncbi:MAG: porin, partial [Comamonadaceae bacterium]|nr:porin [Comamonadaceae bacterium]